MNKEVREYIKEYLKVDEEYLDSHPSIYKLYKNNQLEEFHKMINQNRKLLDILSEWILAHVKLDDISAIIELKEIKDKLNS